MIAYRLIPFLWGFLEGTCFFLVPDIWLTFLACRREKRRSLSVAVVLCILGAIAGGIVMYFSAQHLGDRILIFLDYIPGISNAMIEHAQQMLTKEGLFSLFSGVFQGIPYKIFASEWGLLYGSLWLFIFVSFFSRGIRFVFAVGLTRLICSILDAKLVHANKIKYVLLIVFWVAYYSFYFTQHGF